MPDTLKGINFSEQEFLNMLKGIMNEKNTKKTIELETKGFEKGEKEVSKFNNAWQKLNASDSGSKFMDQLNGISRLLTKDFKNVKLNSFRNQVITALSDPNKSADELISTIDEVYSSLQTLSKISNSGQFEFLSDAQINGLITRQRKIDELEKILKQEEVEATRQGQAFKKDIDIWSLGKTKKIQRKPHSVVAEELGINKSDIDLKRNDDTLLSTYKQTAEVLSKMVEERKELDEIGDAGKFLQQEQDLLTVYNQLKNQENKITSRFQNIDPSKLLTNQFKSSNGKFIFSGNDGIALKEYVNEVTSGAQKALQAAQADLNKRIVEVTNKSLNRVVQKNEIIQQGRINNVKQIDTQDGETISSEIASGMGDAESATDAATSSIQKYLLSADETIGKLKELKVEIENLDKIYNETDDPKVEKQLDEKYGEAAKYIANLKRLQFSDSEIDSILGKDPYDQDWRQSIDTMAPKNTREIIDSIKNYAGETPVEIPVQINDVAIEDTKSSIEILLDYLNQLKTSDLGSLSTDFEQLPPKIRETINELGLLNKEKNGLIYADTGNTNNGVIVGEKSTLISRVGTSEKYEETLRLKDALDQAADAGANVARILDVAFDQSTNTMLELQQTAPGDLISNIPAFGESADNLKFNEALLEATDEQIIKLINDLETLNNLGINIDFTDSNFLYDKQNGFSIVDLAMKGSGASDYGSAEFLEMFNFIKDEFSYAGKDTSAIDAFINRINTAITLREELQKPGGNTGLLETTDSEEKLNTIKTELQSLREELQRFKDTGIEPEGISELQTKLESAEQHIRSLSDELSLLYEHSVSESDYSRLEEELSLAKANAEDLRESLVQVKSELEQSKIEAPLDSDALDKKVTELQYLHDKVRTIFDGPDGIVNEDMTYSEKFNSSEVQRMIELLNQLSDAELRATGVMPDDEDSYNTFRYNLQAEVDAIKETQEMLQQAYDTGNYDGFDASEIDVSIWNRLEHIYEMAQEVTNQFDSKLTPAVREFLGLVEGEIGSENMVGFLGDQNIDSYVNDIISGAKTAKEAFADLENSFGWDTARFDSLIPIEVPQELKGLYDSLFSDVENRIKSAEQAAAEFNAELAKLSTSGNVSASADQSAQSDIQAAEAAEQRAQANEHLAESEKQVDAAESANAGASDIPAQTDDVAVTESAIDAEMSKLDELKNKIATEIPQAVETKNNAFKEEQSVVEGAIGAEINKLDELKQKIDDVTNATKEKNKEFADGQNSNQSNSNKKDKAKKKSQNKTSNTSNQSKTDEDYINEGIGKYKELIKDVDKFAKLKAKAADPKETMTGGEVVKLEEFNNKLKEANQLAEQYGAKSEELTSIQQRFNEVFNVSNQHFQANTKSAKEAAKEQEKAAKQAAEAARKEQEKARKEAEKIQREQATALKNTEKLYANISDGDKTRFEAQFNAVQSAYKRVIGSKGDLNEYQEFIYSLKELQKYSKIGPGEILPKESFSFDEAKAQAEQIVNSYKNVTKGLSGSTQVDDKGLAHWSATVKDAQGNVQQLQFTWNAATNQMAQQARQLPKETVGIGAAIDGVKKKVKELATYWTARLFDPYRLIGGVKQVINIVREYDDALTEMRKVSDESLSTLKQFQQQSFGIADALGTTGKQIQNSTADWLRLGESFDEAKKSAEVSNLLLNVSEFTSIDDATQSLVSASQAYKDLDKLEIVDKLNNIGNNFSVSTDQLAQGLQNAAAVLHTQGNDIDQALALLTAGNAITQDISKTSAGVRTISLRIAGTEEAKNEVADLGEDIDDFVVRTRSKTDQIIRDYTAVASNNYKGVSVLDDNGNLRDTYDILLDIASVYKEIQQEDKQRGTNRANALVETLAGKNRSNIAASILENPELLKDVYEASQQSAGSAMQENEKYLDSISGKMQQMQNHLQEMANIVADSDGLKIILDIINEILSAITKIVDVAGGMSGILGAVGGIFLQKSGFVTGKNGILTQLLFGSSGNVSQTVKKTVKPLSDQLQSELYKWVNDGNFDMGGKFLEQMSSKGISLDAIRGSSTFGPIIEGMSQAEVEALKYSDVMNLAVKGTAELPQVVSKASAAFSTFTGVAKTVGSTLLSMGTAMIASFAIEGVIKLIYNLATAQKRAIEAGKEAQQNIAETAEGYKNTEESLKGVQDEFAKLSTGVDSKGNNVSLSTEEYGRFLELSSQIAEIAPELVTGYDAQGNAIVALGDTVDGVNGKFQEYLNLQRDIANSDIGSNLDVVWKGITNQVAEYSGKLAQVNADYNNAKASFEQGDVDISNSVIGAYGLGLERQDKGVSRDTRYLQIHKDKVDDFVQQMTLNGLAVENIGEVEGSPDVIRFAIPDLSNVEDETLKQLNQYINTSTMTALKDANLSDAQRKKYELLINTEYKKIIPAITDYINTTPFFDQIDGEDLQKKYQDGIIKIFSNLDGEQAANYIESHGGVEAFVDDFIFTMTSNEDVQSAFEGLLDLEEEQANMTSEEITKRRNEYYKTIMDAYKGTDGESVYTEQYLNGFFGDEAYGERIGKAKNKFGLTGPAFNEWFNEAKRGNAEAALTAIEQMSKSEAEKFVNNQEALYEYLLPYLNGEKPEIKAPDSTDTIATLLNDESYKESAEKSASNLSSLTGALETLRAEGQLTAEEMVNLQNSFPDLTEFTTESIQTKAFEELDGWIGKIREGMKGMSDEGKEQARTMIQNMVDQYGDLGVNMSDIAGTYFDSLGIDESKMSGQEMSSYTQDFYDKVEELRSRLESEGLELDTHVLYTLVASDQFSGTADEIYNKYNDAKLNWEIILNQQNLERQIQRNQSVLDKEEAKRSLKQANGEILTKQDYETSFKSAKAIARMRGEELENATTQRDRIGRHDSVEYQNANLKVLEAEKNKLDADAEALRLEKESIEAETNVAQNVLKEADNAVSEAQNAVDKAEAEFGEGMADQKLYDDLAQATAERAAANVGLATVWRQVAERIKDEHPDWYNEFIGNAISAESSAQSDTESAKGYDNSESQKELNKLQEDATKIQRNLTVAEQNHQKVSKSTYNALIHNAKDQIKLLKEEQEGVKDNLSEWRNYQDQIDSLNDSIYEWGTTSESLIYDQASQLASAISSAMSESISETGLTDDTINALKTAFSDLDGSKFDVSDAFYSTADGVKVNTKALQELTEAEFELIGAPLANEIANVQAQLEKDPGNSALQQKLESLMETNAKYFAQYEEMQKALSRNAAIDLAEGTSNAGANYDENYGRVKTYKEAYEKGLTGTDDFKAWTSYLDVYGRDTLEAYEAVSGKIERYFTEDAADGLGNFLTDMEKLGYAAQDADGYWTITADDYDAAAKDMQMGSEWFMDTMNKLEDFGFIHTYVSSLNEAQLKTRDVEEQIADAVQTYSEMVARGASDEELQKQIEHINELESQWQDLDTVTKTWGETAEENRKKEFLGLDDQLSAFKEMYKNADTDAGRDAARKAAEDYVKQFGYTLEEGKFKLSADDLVDYESRITTFSGSMENPLTAEDMGISADNVEKFNGAIENVKQLAESGDLTSLQEAISGLTAEDLKSIDYSDGKYTEGFEAAEGAVDQLRDSLGLAKEDTNLLIDVMTALGLVEGQTVDSVPEKMQDLQDYLSTATKENGEAYQISTDVASQSAEQLQTQLDEIDLAIKAQLDPDSDVYKQLEELKKQTEIQLNIKNSDQTQTQLKEWAEAGDRENIAKTFGIDVNSEEVDKYIEQINNMPSDYDLAIHIDDSQFQTLIESITGKPYQAEVEVVGKDKLTQFVSKIRTKLQNNPITQPIVQKVQQFGQKVKEQVTATVKTGDSNKQVDKVENSVEDLNKTTGTAKVSVNAKGALSNIQNVRNQLLSLNSVVATPRINVITGNATSIISQIRDAINQLRDKTVTLTTIKRETSALGTAHASGTTSLSRAYASGSQDWTVGRDESALVNEIGQESRVRDGVWELIPGGPHVEDLKKDDIIFNAEQTADLIRTGKTARSGKLVAHSNGTVPGMSAYVITGKNRGNKLKKSGGSGGGKSSGGNGGGKGNKGSKNSKTNKTDKKLDAFNKWVEKLFDWIEVRLDRIQWKIDVATQKAENAIGYMQKNLNINQAMRNISSVNGNEKYSLKTVKDSDGVERVTGISYSNIGANNSLINNNLRGADRYLKEANAVRSKATSGKTKILNAKDADAIIAKIQSGQININEYNEKTRKFIDSYKQWYDKAMDCVSAVEDLKGQLKDLEQQKLDNIVDQFDTITGYAEAVKASSEATIDYYNAAGYSKDSKTYTKEFSKQQQRQSEVTKALVDEIAAYKGELANAKNIYGENSNQYREALTKLEEVNKTLIESQKTERELAHALYDTNKTVRGYFIDRVKALVDKFSSIASLSEKRGTTQRYGINIAQSEDPYFEQTRYNNELILKYYEDIKEAQREIAIEGAQINSERYEELYKTITDGESAITSLLSTNEDLKESIRTLRWKGYNEFQEQLNTINSDLEHIQGFIRDGDIMDNDAQFTDLGFAQIALIGEQMDTAEKKIRNAQGAISKLDEEYENHIISLEKYNEELDAQIDIIQDASGAIFDYQQKLADMYIDQITAENDALQDLISARKDALSAKKEYYDYDKTLKNKNKDIAQLQAQINALQGVSNDAAQARRAKLQAELSEKQEDLQDTLYQHSIELQQEGYDKLSEDMQTALDNAVKLINGDQKVLLETAQHMLEELQKSGLEENDIIQGIIKNNATQVHESTQDIIKELESEGGVKKLLESVNLSTQTIGDAVAKQALDSSVKDINTELSITENSLKNDISTSLKEIEIAIGTLTQSEEQKKQEETIREKNKADVQNRLTNLNEQKLNSQANIDNTNLQISSINSQIDDKNAQINALKKANDAINKNISNLYNNADSSFQQANKLEQQADALLKKADKAKKKKDKKKYKQQAQALLNQAAAKKVQGNNYIKQYEKAVAAKPGQIKANDNSIAVLTSEISILTDSLKPLQEELKTLQEESSSIQTEIEAVEKEGLELELKGSLTDGDTAKGESNIAGEVKSPTSLITEKDIEASAAASTPTILTPGGTTSGSSSKSTSSTSKTAAKTPSKKDQFLAAINSGKSHAKKLSSKEKKEHHALWEYLVKQFGRTGTNTVYTKLASLLSVKLKNTKKITSAEKDKILSKLKSARKTYKFAKGTKNLPEDLLAWTNENWDKIGPEIIVRPQDNAILTPMKANDSVIPANLADNLFKWGAISPDKFITNPFVGKWDATGSGSSSITNDDSYLGGQTVEMHFDSLFHIEGNVDESVMPRLENLGKSLVNDRDFQKNVIKFVTKDFVRESKKQGIR